MFSPLIRKLGHGADLLEVDRARLTRLACVRRVEARHQIIGQGERPENVHLVLEGFACCYKILRNGKRQIVALLVPGDFCDLHSAILGAMDHSIVALSACTIADLPRSTILDLTENHPRIARALQWSALVDAAILREWLVNVGQREANQRLAHLICELLVRLQVAGIGDADGYHFPLTQRDLADVLGLTPVHVNRTLQMLRAKCLITLQRRRVSILDVDRLKTYCDFDSSYLHLVK